MGAIQVKRARLAAEQSHSTTCPRFTLETRLEGVMTDITPEQKLWQAVVYRAFADATDSSPDHATSREKSEAISWIKGNGRNYRQVVTMAGMCPDFLRDAFLAGRVNAKLLRSNLE
jgi:hypothetical protein